MNKIGMSLTVSHPDKMPVEEQIALFSKTGFHSFFLSSGVTDNYENIPKWSLCADKYGIEFEAVHTPGHLCNHIWSSSLKGDDSIKALKYLVDICSNCNIDKLVIHPANATITEISSIGILRYTQLCEYAESKKIHICFENTDTNKHLFALMENIGTFHGLCFDSGHHNCCSPNEPIIEQFGNRILYTHLHDNMGANYTGNKSKDMHLLPFEGTIDWQNLVNKLKNAKYSGTLNLELSCMWKQSYKDMSYPDFVYKAYLQAEKLRKSFNETDN